MLSIDDKMLKTDKRVDDCEKSVVCLATKDNDFGNPTAYAVKNKGISVKGQMAPCQSHKNSENPESKGDTTGYGLPKTRRENNPRTSEEDGWKVPREQRLRDFQRKRNIVTGTAGNRQFLGDHLQQFLFFLYRVEKPATEQDIEDCLQDNEMSTAKVVKISNSEARYCSFKLLFH